MWRTKKLLPLRNNPYFFIRFFTAPYQSVEKDIPGFFNCRLAKDASANLTIFLALKDEAELGTTSLWCASPFFNGLLCRS
jgi:hypothetical protein